MSLVISIRHTVDRFTIGRCRALVRENYGHGFGEIGGAVVVVIGGVIGGAVAVEIGGVVAYSNSGQFGFINMSILVRYVNHFVFGFVVWVSLCA